MYYELSFFKVDTIMSSKGHTSRRFDYFEAANEKEAEEKLRKKHDVHSIECIKEVTEEVYKSVYNENSNPLMIHGLPTEGEIRNISGKKITKIIMKDITSLTDEDNQINVTTEPTDDSVKVTIVCTGFQEESKND